MIVRFSDTEHWHISPVAQPETIEVSKSLSCMCGEAVFTDYKSFEIIGYTCTQSGYMIVCECSKCGDKYRQHIQTTGRNDIELFKKELAVILHLQTKFP